MHIAVLGNPNSWYLQDLKRAAGLRTNGTIRFSSLPFSAVASSITSKSDIAISVGAQSLEQFDAVLVRTMPPGSLEQVIFRMDALALFAQQGGIVLNSPRAIEIAVDKYLSLALLAQAQISVPRTHICQTVDEAMAIYEQWGPELVIKPLFGGEGRGITRVSDQPLALRAFKMISQLDGIIYLQEYIAHAGFDIRILVVGEKTFSMRRINPDDWRTNVSRGATVEHYEPTDELIQLAKRSAHTVKAQIAGVDILIAPDGTPTVLEVNAVPGWKGLAKATETDIALEILLFIEEQVANGRRNISNQELGSNRKS